MFNTGKPILVENGTQYFLKSLLKQCHGVKMEYYNNMYNIGLLLLFFFILFTFLIYIPLTFIFDYYMKGLNE